MIFGLRIKVFFLGLVFSIPLFGNPQANESRSFANHLYQEKDYYRAITEYKRFLFLNPNHPQTNTITFSIGFSYLQGEKYNAALPYFEKLLSEKEPWTSYAELSLAQTFLAEKKYDAALREWNNFITQFPKNSFTPAAHYQKAWTTFLTEDIEQTKIILNSLEKTSLQNRVDNFMGALERWENRPTRSPFLAGLMSTVIPGTGQWYTGRFWDGASALVINGLFIYGIYYFFHKEKYVAGGILTLIGSGFYGGNIFSAVSGAHKFNKQIKESLREEFQTKYGIGFDWNGVQLSVRF